MRAHFTAACAEGALAAGEVDNWIAGTPRDDDLGGTRLDAVATQATHLDEVVVVMAPRRTKLLTITAKATEESSS
ncbi:MAG TPA: hypothetical protein P5114_08350 [Hyphomicrobiaceae bacterium]|nr:hypothetical protein [Hyphomicrobiaceae bacterium]